MLNYIFDILQNYDFPGSRLFGYTSFRVLIAIVLSLLISAIFGILPTHLIADATGGSGGVQLHGMSGCSKCLPNILAQMLTGGLFWFKIGT